MKKYYPVIFTKENDGFSTVAVDLQGCFSEGDTFEEAYENTQSAIGLYLSDLKEYPEASNPISFNNSLANNEFICIVEFDSIDYQKKNSLKPIKKTLTIPEWLNQEAEKQHINFSSVLKEALINKLNV